MMFAAVTDHVFIDGGHTIDFTNKAFEALDHLGTDAAAEVLPTLVRQTTGASRSEEFGEWRHPHNHAALAQHTIASLADAQAVGADARGTFDEVGALGWTLLDDDPQVVVAALLDALRAGRVGRTTRTRDCVRGRATHRAVPRAERPRRLGHGAPHVHRGQRVASESAAPSHAGAHARRRAHCAAHQPRPVPQRARGAHAADGHRQPRRARPLLRRAGHGRRSRRARPTASCTAAEPEPSWSPHSVMRSWPKTPSSTGSRRSRRVRARRGNGPKVPRNPRSCSPPSRASSPRTHRLAASYRRS